MSWLVSDLHIFACSTDLLAEVRAALEAATRLPFEVRQQIDIARAASQSQSHTPTYPNPPLQLDYSIPGQYPSGTDDTTRFTELSPGVSSHGRSLSADGSLVSQPMYSDPSGNSVYGYTGTVQPVMVGGVPGGMAPQFGYAQQGYAFPPQQPQYQVQQQQYIQQQQQHGCRTNGIQGWSG